MIFIGGVGPRKKKVNKQPRICSNCGLAQAYLFRVDNYLSLFFIPVLRLRRGEPVIECERCGHVTDESGITHIAGTDLAAPRCSGCGATLREDFRFCPHCGQAR